jgi:hypothetical protein
MFSAEDLDPVRSSECTIHCSQVIDMCDSTVMDRFHRVGFFYLMICYS